MNTLYKRAMKVIALPFTLGWMGMVMWLGAKVLGFLDQSNLPVLQWHFQD